MDKLIALLKSAGVSETLANGIVEATVEYKNAIKEEYNKEYLKRVALAKKVVLEEIEQHKADLSRRMQIWCESKTTQVERRIASQSAIKESAALTALERVKALVEGVELNSQTNVELQTEVKKLQAKVTNLTEENQRQKTVIGRHMTLAESALKRNRLLESKLVSKTDKPVLTEGRAQPTTIVRKKAVPVSTRRTIHESQTRVAPKTDRAASSDWDVSNIAKHVE